MAKIDIVAEATYSVDEILGILKSHLPQDLQDGYTHSMSFKSDNTGRVTGIVVKAVSMG